MASFGNFIPADNSTVTLACTTSTGARQFRASIDVGLSVRIYNAGPDVAYVRFTNATSTATAPSGATVGGMPIPVGDIEVFPAGTATFISALCPTSTATLFVTVGEGS